MRMMIARAAAMALLALLAGDLVDTGCDPLILPGNQAIAGTVAEGADDPCEGACVPDCFCCSTSVPATRLSPIARSVESLAVSTPPVTQAVTGFVAPIDHVPLAAL